MEIVCVWDRGGAGVGEAGIITFIRSLKSYEMVHTTVVAAKPKFFLQVKRPHVRNDLNRLDKT